MVQWVIHLTIDHWMLGSHEFKPHQRRRCFLEQEILHSLLSKLVLVGYSNKSEPGSHMVHMWLVLQPN